MVGLVGAPLLLAAVAGTLLGIIDQVSAVGFLSAVLIAAWEIALGFWLLLKGFDAEAWSGSTRQRSPASSLR